MFASLKGFLGDDTGAVAGEYVLLLAIVGSSIAAGAVYLSGNLARALNGTGDRICTTPQGGPTICRPVAQD
jgi:Flp pilus assembly pilin Flp